MGLMCNTQEIAIFPNSKFFPKIIVNILIAKVTDMLEHHIGLFDFKNYADLVDVLCDVLNRTKKEVHEMLFYEALEIGWNVSRASKTFGVTPHIYNSRMQNLYQQSDAFVFELLVTHSIPYCREIDRRVSEALTCHFNGARDLQILVYGDGVGTDSLRLQASGYNVSYFEFEGYSSKIAEYRFRRQGLDKRITVINHLDQIPQQYFDAVVCREVLEHVSDPPGVVEIIRDSLNENGIALITESFGRIEPAFPTHLAKNLKFHGRTEYIFINTGFRLLQSYPEKRPLIFKKTKKSDWLRFYSHKNRYHVLRNLMKDIKKRLINTIWIL